MATTKDGAIDLDWTAPDAGTAATYRVARQQRDGEWTTLTDTAQTTHSDDAAQTNVQNRYWVQHRNQHSGSTWTESDPVTLIAPLGQPVGNRRRQR